MSIKNYQRIMIFGLPGSGKSTFATHLAKRLELRVHHLDRWFFVENWIERDKDEFLKIQQSFVETDQWIIDGNAVRSLEMRYSRADLVLYFHFSRLTCLVRILKRLFIKDPSVPDRAMGCSERISLRLIRYMWGFDKRVTQTIADLRSKYPNTEFLEIRNSHDLKSLQKKLLSRQPNSSN